MVPPERLGRGRHRRFGQGGVAGRRLALQLRRGFPEAVGHASGGTRSGVWQDESEGGLEYFLGSLLRAASLYGYGPSEGCTRYRAPRSVRLYPCREPEVQRARALLRGELLGVNGR